MPAEGRSHTQIALDHVEQHGYDRGVQDTLALDGAKLDRIAEVLWARRAEHSKNRNWKLIHPAVKRHYVAYVQDVVAALAPTDPDLGENDG